MRNINPTDVNIAEQVKAGKVKWIKPKIERDQIKTMNSEQILSIIPPPIEYAAYPILPAQGIAFVYAASGIGKTLFSLNLAYAIAQGGSFLKYKCPKPRKILYIDGEMPYTQLHSRFMKIVEQQGELDNPDNFHLLNHEKCQPFRLPKICDLEGQQFYTDLIENLGIEVLFIDNLSMLSAIDENKAAEWKPIQDWFLDLRSRGIAVVVIHHAGKDKTGYRGTSRMLDCVDTAISLQSCYLNDLDSERNKSTKFKISYEKGRTLSGEEKTGFEAALTINGWEYTSSEQNNLEKIVEMMNLGLKQTEIANELGFHRSYICKMVKKIKPTDLLPERR